MPQGCGWRRVFTSRRGANVSVHANALASSPLPPRNDARVGYAFLLCTVVRLRPLQPTT